MYANEHYLSIINDARFLAVMFSVYFRDAEAENLQMEEEKKSLTYTIRRKRCAFQDYQLP